jgi:hypothetical protein
MGEPRGSGGPWLDTAVAANTASDPFLMYGYGGKQLRLSAAAATTITVEIDFLADNTWSVYRTFDLAAGQSLTHQFPAGFHAHWARVKSSAATTATAQFSYGPAETRDRFLDWARAQNLPTGAGRQALYSGDADNDGLPVLMEFLVAGSSGGFDAQPMLPGAGFATFLLRDLTPEDRIICQVQFSTDLRDWEPLDEGLTVSPDQSGVPSGFSRMRVAYPAGMSRIFLRLLAR